MVHRQRIITSVFPVFFGTRVLPTCSFYLQVLFGSVTYKSKGASRCLLRCSVGWSQGICRDRNCLSAYGPVLRKLHLNKSNRVSDVRRNRTDAPAAVRTQPAICDHVSCSKQLKAFDLCFLHQQLHSAVSLVGLLHVLMYHVNDSSYKL
jgi:hypothetical protein